VREGEVTELVPLIDRDMHGRLVVLRSEIKAAGIGHVSRVFVPVSAAPAATSPTNPRVLFVGKATSGYGERALASFDGARRRDDEIVRDWLPNGCSPFWQFAREILRQTLRSLDITVADSELPSFCGWSNLAKIGDTRANPPPESIEIQKMLCVEVLRSEIAFFKPTAVVAVPQNYAQQKIMEPVFGDETTWHFDTAERDRVAYRFHGGLGTLVIWANHPQGMRPSGTRAIVQKFAADLIVGAVRGVNLRPGVIQPRP
jgi:hypothetical protein